MGPAGRRVRGSRSGAGTIVGTVTPRTTPTLPGAARRGIDGGQPRALTGPSGGTVGGVRFERLRKNVVHRLEPAEPELPPSPLGKLVEIATEASNATPRSRTTAVTA